MPDRTVRSGPGATTPVLNLHLRLGHLPIVRQLPQEDILDDLISWYGLSHRKKEIEQIACRAALLKSHAIEESETGLGETKIGGHPDLPEGPQWPTHRRGKPLAILAQINLSDVRRTVRLRDLPESGILYFFSVYGWQVEDDADPQLPHERPDSTWTQILLEPQADAVLRRRDRPSGVNGFKAARVEIIPTISLPDGNEPVVRALIWTEDEVERFNCYPACSFKAVRDYGLGHPASHLLLGYADYEQESVDFVLTLTLHKPGREGLSNAGNPGPTEPFLFRSSTSPNVKSWNVRNLSFAMHESRENRRRPAFRSVHPERFMQLEG